MHGGVLPRMIRPTSGVRLGARPLLAASALLLPFVVERCVLDGDSKIALKATVGLGLIPRAVNNSNKLAAGASGKQRRQRRHPLMASSSSSSSPQQGKDGGGEDERQYSTVAATRWPFRARDRGASPLSRRRRRCRCYRCGRRYHRHRDGVGLWRSRLQ